MSEAEGLIERLRAETSSERREEILAKGWDTAVKSLYDEIKATGEHGDYQRLIFESWVIDGKDELLLKAATALQQAISDKHALAAERNEGYTKTGNLERALTEWIARAQAAEAERDEALWKLKASEEHARNMRNERDWAQEVDVKAAEDRANAAEAQLQRLTASLEDAEEALQQIIKADEQTWLTSLPEDPRRIQVVDGPCGRIARAAIRDRKEKA